ncbi:Peptidyl-tRNA hydrolase [Limihaloglobus sulfuriphilus]|uniref:Peptidyl-tRNA hydrolase n=1 Tax=Limihaloglobus sulfuriphilus TaxID=1851148 RepID=A0A1Q2MBJ0_9BACT|nr:aminoacyl-tRNA hydrolase [Limihaloglobus sulfuriphilus]AQQ70095.1 Peptidyl-tRNA hydrolase [Limihaloglobus sulfuriphilus]
MSDVKLIAGLGNPGSKYQGSRHNAGFDVIDILAKELGCEVREKKFSGLFGCCSFEGCKIMLLKPQTYMNLSGQSIATVKGFYKLELNQVLVVADDMALEPGRIRLRAAGSAGGHNGLADIIEKLGSNRFARLRVGIGQSSYPDSRDYVLSRPQGQEAQLLKESFNMAAKAVKYWMQYGINKAMTEFNGMSAEIQTEINNVRQDT